MNYIGHTGTLLLNKVQASSTGTATVTIYYVDGDAGRSAQMSVNGGASTTITFHSTNNGNWNFVQNLVVSVALKTGSNTIKFSNTTGWSADIDRITVTTSTTNPTPTPVNPTPTPVQSHAYACESYTYSCGKPHSCRHKSLWRPQSRLHVRWHNS